MQQALAKAAACVQLADPQQQMVLALARLLQLSAAGRPWNCSSARGFAEAARQRVHASPGASGHGPTYNSSSGSSGNSSGGSVLWGVHHKGSQQQLNSSSLPLSSSSGRILQQSPSLPRPNPAQELQLQQLQRIAEVTQQDVQQLLHRHPQLAAYLRGGQLSHSGYLVNLTYLSLHPAQLAAPEHARLRAVLAVMPPSMLQDQLQDEGSVLSSILEQQQQQQQSQQGGAGLGQLTELLLNMLGPLRPLQRQQQEQLQQHTQAQAQQQQQPEPCSVQRFYEVAEAVVNALGPPDQLCDMDSKAAARRRLGKVRTHPKNSNTSSSSSGSSGASGSPSSSSGFASSTRSFTTASTSSSLAADLAACMHNTAQARHVRKQPVHDARVAATIVQQLQQAVGLADEEVLQLLLARPLLLWRHSTPVLPQQLLSGLTQLLPDLGQKAKLSRLVLKQPRLLSLPFEHFEALLDVLCTRLQLSQEEAAAAVLRHPRLLVCPIKRLLPNVGFLVGLGLLPGDLRSMALHDPTWLTRSLRDLTVQWHFLQQVAKVSLQDLVLCPKLLVLPLKGSLGPRVLYARKRGIKLLAPSLAALVSRSWSREAQAEWRQHKMVPLDFLVSVPDKRMCDVLGFNAADYARFKAAWAVVDGVNWDRYSLSQRRGEQVVLAA